MPQGCFQQVSCQRLDLLGVYCHRSLRLQGTAGWKNGLRWWICSVFVERHFVRIGELTTWWHRRMEQSDFENVAIPSFSRRMKCKEPRPSWPFVFSMDWFHASWELSQPWWSSSCALICPTNHGCESYWSGSWSFLKIYIRQVTIGSNKMAIINRKSLTWTFSSFTSLRLCVLCTCPSWIQVPFGPCQTRRSSQSTEQSEPRDAGKAGRLNFNMGLPERAHLSHFLALAYTLGKATWDATRMAQDGLGCNWKTGSAFWKVILLRFSQSFVEFQRDHQAPEKHQSPLHRRRPSLSVGDVNAASDAPCVGNLREAGDKRGDFKSHGNGGHFCETHWGS